MEQPIQPIVPEGTPLPTPPVGVPPFPITPFAVWTWSSPVIPEFYWNVYSSEQRIKQICKEIGKIEAYLNYLVNKTNENIIEILKRLDTLTDRVAALEKKVEEEVARLDALIAQLRADLEQEIKDREDGDAALGARIDQEILDRTHEDDELHKEISTETQARIHEDDKLHREISQRLLPTDIQAGAEIEITRPDPESNTIVIASTVAHSISELASTVSGLQAALNSETEERRADDEDLWQAVNQRIERGKILAGPGIKVENDPDSSTVTISATGGSGGATEITGTAPITVTDGDAGEKIVGVSAATEEEPGVITEARVKELAGGVAPSLSAEEPLKLEGGTISLAKDPNGPVTSSRVGLSVREITPSTESESEAGVVSKATIKSLAQYSGAIDEGRGLRIYEGKVGVHMPPDSINYKSPLAFAPGPGRDVGSLILTDAHIITGEKELLSRDDAEQLKYRFREGRTWLVDLGSPQDAYTAWVGGKVKAEYRTAASAAWQAAKGYTGDYLHLEVDSAPEYPGRGALYVNISAAGYQAMEQGAWTNMRVTWSIIPVQFGIK